MPNNILKEFIFFQNSYVNTTRLKILNMIKKNSVPFTPRPNKSSEAPFQAISGDLLLGQTRAQARVQWQLVGMCPALFWPPFFFLFLWFFLTTLRTFFLPSLFLTTIFFQFFWSSFFYPHLELIGNYLKNRYTSFVGICLSPQYVLTHIKQYFFFTHFFFQIFFLCHLFF